MIDVDDRDVFIRKVDHFLAQGAFAEALELARERLVFEPHDLETTMVVCQSWLGLGNLVEAEKSLAALERAHIRMASLFKSLGDTCLKENRKRDAVVYFQKGLALLPEAFTSSQLSQMATDAVGTFDEQSPVQEAGREERAMDAEFNTVTMADLYVKQGHLQAAVDVLEVIREREPEKEEVLRRLRDVKALMAGQSTADSGAPSAVLAELSKWLQNVDRIRSHDRPDHRPR